MSFQNYLRKSAISLLAIAGFASVSFAQQLSLIERPMSVAGSNNLYCAGYVQTGPVNTANKIVGAVEEQNQFLYSENNFLWINMGSDKGVHVGDMFSVIRPRGEVNSKWTRKDNLGFYVQELGALEVVSVKANVSAVRVKTSCNAFLLGDLVTPIEARVSPQFRPRPQMDIFADPSGKANGRIIMARDNQEAVTRDQIVYIDLGREDSVQPGDYLTVYRKLGKGGLFISDEDESVSARDSGFSSHVYAGGKFSNQAARKSGDTADGRVVTTERAKEDRPENMRKIVGELVVLNVKERTATAVITRTAQEIHTGDWVEVQ